MSSRSRSQESNTLLCKAWDGLGQANLENETLEEILLIHQCLQGPAVEILGAKESLTGRNLDSPCFSIFFSPSLPSFSTPLSLSLSQSQSLLLHIFRLLLFFFSSPPSSSTSSLSSSSSPPPLLILLFFFLLLLILPFFCVCTPFPLLLLPLLLTLSLILLLPLFLLLLLLLVFPFFFF